MNDQFLLQTIWRVKDTLRLLVEAEGPSWRLCLHEVDSGCFPIEAALTYAEHIFGSESVCSLWKLGQIETTSGLTHLFCLDVETIEGFSGEKLIHNMLWTDEQGYYKNIPNQFKPLLEKMRQAGPSR